MIPKTLLLSLLLLCGASAFATQVPPTVEPLNSSSILKIKYSETYTYVRCWYRPHTDHNDPATEWEWALAEDGSYYTISGYWWSSTSYKNMFYSFESQSNIQDRCKKTLNVEHETADITYFASDHGMSYNHAIWSNDALVMESKINRIIAFGDSLSDTGNIFNGSQWLFPNRNAWFLGHFSNGFVWTEYLAKEKNIPLYNWAVGGAAGQDKYLVLTGVYGQVSSYLTYMKMALNYNPENTLFTLEFGLNDFMNYHRKMSDVKADFSSALIRLTDSGAKNILVLTLPDASQAPQFKYSSQAEIQKVSAQIKEFNVFIKGQANYYQLQGYNIVLFDAEKLFSNITKNPKKHGFKNSKDACLDINRSSSRDYLYSHNLTDECADYGSDAYVFWGVTHPTTAMHKYIADNILKTAFNTFSF
ncbi:Thermolabile hemolysin (TL)-(Lecithin-dependent hemolysin) (LDH) [Psychromonas sp. CNPT3]|uniref:SGNH/GDSL hydrolase family protein n=1 Tax=Psychromonas sp. CNPT3 TaxID=314282 RepID=UPI00006E486E|nr:SGNH/GDSL hydrolase family protein [Psychromonas sp. CNPT3]AGH82214.1 Thermolabile hemolysin (TL)-(Lecithin-dependent hemolysin) (LDH) [Psychromonas sp. CNPT3]